MRRSKVFIHFWAGPWISIFLFLITSGSTPPEAYFNCHHQSITQYVQFKSMESMKITKHSHALCKAKAGVLGVEWEGRLRGWMEGRQGCMGLSFPTSRVANQYQPQPAASESWPLTIQRVTKMTKKLKLLGFEKAYGPFDPHFKPVENVPLHSHKGLSPVPVSPSASQHPVLPAGQAEPEKVPGFSFSPPL